MTEAVVAAGGEELQWLGDGLLAGFSSTADAVRCAIGIQQTARRPAARVRFEIRIGIRFGEVVRRDGGYFGTPLVTARRLCDRASPGQILCSSLIPQLLAARQSFEFRKLGELKFKDLAKPVGVCEVVYERNNPTAMLNRTPFFGRAAQLERLSIKLEEACNGRGSVVMLRGEPGIGKTRTLQEFAEFAVQRGAAVLRGACYDGNGSRRTVRSLRQLPNMCARQTPMRSPPRWARKRPSSRASHHRCARRCAIFRNRCH